MSADVITGAGARPDVPARIPGVGPVDRATARQVAATAPWRRLVADPSTGVLVHRGRRAIRPSEASTPDLLDALLCEPVTDAADLTTAAYQPSERLRQHVVIRDQTCIGPACSHPARGTQFDHTLDWGTRSPAGARGTTSHDNGGSLCQRGHNAKTHGGWTLAQPVPGDFTWTSPTGRTYHVPAKPILPGWTPPPAPATDQTPGRRTGLEPP